jgi:hypothetical protein
VRAAAARRHPVGPAARFSESPASYRPSGKFEFLLALMRLFVVADLGVTAHDCPEVYTSHRIGDMGYAEFVSNASVAATILLAGFLGLILMLRL